MSSQVRKLRALIAVRLSRVTDATTSPERQLAKCRELCEQRSYEIVGVVEDLDVSAGKTTPFERPALRQWIGDGRGNPGRSNEFDVIVFYRVDRIVRRLFDLADLIRWSREHSVTLVSATETHFDLSTEFGGIIALLVAKVAEMELSAISERNASAARHNIRAGVDSVKAYAAISPFVVPARAGYALRLHTLADAAVIRRQIQDVAA